MAWYPLYDDEHLAFPQELREAVLKERKRSRSKHKAHDEDEYVWAIYWCVRIGPGINMVYPYLALRWKFRLQSNWQTEIEGPHSTYDEELGCTDDHWDSIDEVLSSVGLNYDNTRPSEYS